MTHEPRNTERELRDLFRAARQADGERAPSFSAMTRPALAAPSRRPGLWRLAFVGATTGVAATAIAVAALWLAAPRAVVPGERDAYASEPALEAPPATAERLVPPEPGAQPETAPTALADIEVRVRGTNQPVVQLSEEIAERVKVTAKTDVVELDETAQSTKSSDEFIQDLPVPGRFYQNVLTPAPGVQVAEGDSNPNVHGPRERDFKTTVRRISNVDPLTGQQMSQVNPNSIEAMEAITAGAGVEFSRAQGGFVRLARGGVVGGVPGGVLGKPKADPRIGEEPGNTESYQPLEENEFLAVTENPLSTFSIDVDTASYSNLRRFLVAGQLPPRDAVRIEELVNYFSYDYPPPAGDAPFSASVEVADCPWNPDHRLARVGLKGREIERGAHPGSNLVFLIDVSGSMDEPSKLPLLRSALALLVEQLSSRDQVAIVVYAGASGLALPPTSGDAKAEILDAIGRLQAGGSTNGGEGLRLAYRIAREGFVPGGVNRVILATDGDFNVGVTDRGELLRAIESDAKKGIFLTALGFGYGNLKDDRLEHLADKGNGNYAYIDRLAEARKVLVEEMTGTLVTIAKDVKIQVEFNPLEVGAYRLIGYENRLLKKEDFNDDRKDAGEIGAGHTVTALYELVPPERPVSVPPVDPLKYQSGPQPTRAAEGGELFTLRLRYKDPESDSSRQLSFPVVDDGLGLDAASVDFKFAAAVAEVGLLLRGSALAGAASFDSAEKRAAEGIGADERGLRAEFLELLRAARTLRGGSAGS